MHILYIIETISYHTGLSRAKHVQTDKTTLKNICFAIISRHITILSVREVLPRCTVITATGYFGAFTNLE